MAIFEGKTFSKDIINNDTMNDDEVVVSYVPRGTCYNIFFVKFRLVSSVLRAFHLLKPEQCSLSLLPRLTHEGGFFVQLEFSLWTVIKNLFTFLGFHLSFSTFSLSSSR